MMKQTLTHKAWNIMFCSLFSMFSCYNWTCLLEHKIKKQEFFAARFISIRECVCYSSRRHISTIRYGFFLCSFGFLLIDLFWLNLLVTVASLFFHLIWRLIVWWLEKPHCFIVHELIPIEAITIKYQHRLPLSKAAFMIANYNSKELLQNWRASAT